MDDLLKDIRIAKERGNDNVVEETFEYLISYFKNKKNSKGFAVVNALELAKEIIDL